MSITDAEIEKLRELERAATPGPWRRREFTYAVHAPGASCWIPQPDNDGADAELIAAARNALPGLLDEIERLKMENLQLRVGLDVRTAERDAARAELAAANVESAQLRAARNNALAELAEARGLLERADERLESEGHDPASRVRSSVRAFLRRTGR